ncbi:MAG: transferase [Alphaproteobacteria bacterium CG_4_9_14_3_um_filter_47_13]|nr:MAG: transferase [Alphaproteobacteria bacterium CG_4_9_14_3_um_filter_47_13]
MTHKIDIIGGKDYIAKQIVKHLQLLYDISPLDKQTITSLLPAILEKTQLCWQGINNKYYHQNGRPLLDINHSNQYCQFLLILTRHVSAEGHKCLANKLFSLNKMLNSCDIYHEIELPECFYIDHSLGIVLGRAQYGERLFLSQNCTIGSNPGSSDYPVLGKDNFLMSNVTLIGKIKTEDRVIFASGSYVKDRDIPSDSIVFGRSPDNIIKTLPPEKFKKASPFNHDFL